jgi:hypothetical protein
VIEDLEGATSEPPRRRHVAALSAATAAVALVLLYLLLVPAPRRDTPPLAVSPAPSPTNGTVVTFAPGPLWLRSGQVSQIPEVVTMTPCLIAPGSNPPAQVMVFDRSGQPMATYTRGTTEPLSSPDPDHWGELSFTVPCDDQVAPLREDETSTECAAGVGSSPRVHLVFDREGRFLGAYTSGQTGRFISLPRAYVGSGWLTVPCDTSDVFAPRLNRAR